MRPQTQHGIHPLCDKHYCPMVPGPASNGEPKRPVFACTVDQCLRHYEVLTGYFSVLDGRILADKYGNRACIKDECCMYVEAYDSQEQEETWRCPAANCDGHLRRSTRFPDFLSVS